MNLFACTTDKYEKLYAPWLGRSGDLLDWAGINPDDTLLDLCGGTGVVALDAVERGLTSVWLLDLNPRCRDHRVCEVQGRAEDAEQLVGRTFSLVVCRQALGYLDLDQTVEAVYQILEPGGRFVFNNFLRPRWGWKRYLHEGNKFLEISCHVGNHVIHLQASPTIGADISIFRWHKHENVLAAFQKRFQVSFEERGRTIRYLCRK